MKHDELPRTWEMGTLHDVASKPQYGWTTKASRTGIKLKLLRTSDISSGRVNWDTVPTCVNEPQEPSDYFLAKGDILVARAGSVGKSILMREAVTDAVFASYLVRFRPLICPEYIDFFMASRLYWSQIEDKSAGIAIPNVNASKLGQVALPVAPLPEQLRIVEKIETLFAWLDKGEEAVRQVQALLKRYRQSVLKAAVTGDLTADWRAANRDRLEHGRDLLARILKTRREKWQGRGRYKEPTTPDTSELPKLPEGWMWASIDQVTSVFGNGLSKKPTSEATDFPILRISSTRAMKVSTDDKRYYVPSKTEDLSSYWVQPGDFLFTRYNGSGHLVGVCGRYRDEEPVLHPDKLIKVRSVDFDGIDGDFLELAWNAGITRKHIERNTKTTSGQQGVAGSDIKAAPFPLPPSFEQVEIGLRVTEALERASDLETWCETELARSAALRQSILKQAFSGQLVPQDPSDEPASALLARIKASQAAAPGKARKSKSRV